MAGPWKRCVHRLNPPSEAVIGLRAISRIRLRGFSEGVYGTAPFERHAVRAKGLARS